MLLRNAAWNFCAQGVRLLTAMLLIALLDPAARGVQSLLILLPTLVGSLALLGMSSAAPVVLAKHHSIDERRLLANLFGLGLVILLVVGLMVAPFVPIAAHYLSGQYLVTPRDLLVGFLLLPPFLLGEYLRALQVARRDLRQVALGQMVQALTQLLLAVVLVLVLRSGPFGAVWAAVIGAWAGFGWTLWSLRGLSSLWPRLDGTVLRPLLGLGLRGHLGNIVQTFNYRLDALLLQGFVGQGAVGLYQTGVLLAELVWYVPNAAGAALLPHVAATNDRNTTPRIVRHTLLLTMLGSILLLLVAWPGLSLLRPAYAGAVVPMAILLVGVVALGIHKVLASDLSGRGLPHYPSLTSALALVVTVAGNLALIPTYGIVGAAIASSLAYVAQTVVLLRIYSNVANVSWRELLVLRRDDLRLYQRLMPRRAGVES